MRETKRFALISGFLVLSGESEERVDDVETTHTIQY